METVNMNLSSVGAVMTAETQRQTLEKVNINLQVKSQDQVEDITNQLLESVSPPASSSSSSLGQHVDIMA